MTERKEAARHTLVVVVASFRSVELLESCLAALEVARGRLSMPAPVYVARDSAAPDASHLFDGRPWARLVPVDVGPDVPRLRGAGMEAAGGGWIAVTEDHCVADPEWLSVLTGETRGGHQVVGGGMGNARDGALNWGAFFSEYGFFSASRPAADGAGLVTGANVMYGPDVSPLVASWAGAGMWEDVIHQRLAAQDVSFAFRPAARVRQNDGYTLVSFCRDRFEHGLDYARVRTAEDGGSHRAVRILTSPLLPFVLTNRVWKAAGGEGFWTFLRALPFTLTFLAAWSAGEAAGYASAQPSTDSTGRP